MRLLAFHLRCGNERGEDIGFISHIQLNVASLYQLVLKISSIPYYKNRGLMKYIIYLVRQLVPTKLNFLSQQIKQPNNKENS